MILLEGQSIKKPHQSRPPHSLGIFVYSALVKGQEDDPSLCQGPNQPANLRLYCPKCRFFCSLYESLRSYGFCSNMFRAVYTNVQFSHFVSFWTVRLSNLNIYWRQYLLLSLISCVSEHTLVSYWKPNTVLLGLIVPLEHRKKTKNKLMNGNVARSPLGHCYLEEQYQRTYIPCWGALACYKGVLILSLHSSSSLPCNLALLFTYFLMQLSVPDYFCHSSNRFLKCQAYCELQVGD